MPPAEPPLNLWRLGACPYTRAVITASEFRSTNLIRVLVANHPRLIRELVTATISDQPDIEVVGEAQHESELEGLVESKRPDVLIVALERTKELSRACRAILQGHPEMRVVAIAPDRRRSMSFWTSLHIESRPIDTCEAGVLEAIRADRTPVDREPVDERST